MGGAEARSAPGSLLGRSRADHGGQFHGSRFCHVMFVTFRSGSELAWLMGICEVGEVRTGSLLASKEAGIGRSWEARCSILQSEGGSGACVRSVVLLGVPAGSEGGPRAQRGVQRVRSSGAGCGMRDVRFGVPVGSK